MKTCIWSFRASLCHSALDAESQKTKVVWENEEVRKKSEIAGQGEQ